jgi:hypothetical protein
MGHFWMDTSYKNFADGLKKALSGTDMDDRVENDLPFGPISQPQKKQISARQEALKFLQEKVKMEVDAITSNTRQTTEPIHFEKQIDLVALVQDILDQAATQGKLTDYDCKDDLSPSESSSESVPEAEESD